MIQYKSLEAFGCSLTEGAELQNEVEGYEEGNIFQQNHCWAKLLAEKLNINEVNNYGLSSSSNDSILRKVTNRLLETNYDRSRLYTIMFTSPQRREYRMNAWSDNNVINGKVDHPLVSIENDDDCPKGWFRMVMGQYEYIPNRRIEKFQKAYEVAVWNDYEDAFNYLQNVYILQQILENNKIPYMFSQGLSLPPRLTKEILLSTNEIGKLYKGIRHKQKFFGFMEREMSFCNIVINELGEDHIHPFSHPNSKGHELFAKRFYDFGVQNHIFD